VSSAPDAERVQLADADDGSQAVAQGGPDLEVHGLVGLAEVAPAFGVAELDEGAAERRDHRGGHLARERPARSQCMFWAP
jgi:hypothetical protein